MGAKKLLLRIKSSRWGIYGVEKDLLFLPGILKQVL